MIQNCLFCIFIYEYCNVHFSYNNIVFSSSFINENLSFVLPSNSNKIHPQLFHFPFNLEKSLSCFLRIYLNLNPPPPPLQNTSINSGFIIFFLLFLKILMKKSIVSYFKLRKNNHCLANIVYILFCYILYY